MARIHVYLPKDLFAMAKALGLPASELLQGAVRAEIRRRELEAASQQYIDELAEEVGQPSVREHARAKRLAQRIAARRP